MVQDLEKDVFCRRHGINSAIWGDIAIAALQPNGGTAQDGKSGNNDGRGNKQHTEHELADGSPARNLGYEDAHEWRPGYPPRPVEGGPRGQEGHHVFALAHVGREHLRHFIEIFNHHGRQHIGQEGGRPHDEEEQGQCHGQHQVDIGEPPNALGHAGDGREDRSDGQYHDDYQRRGIAGGRPAANQFHAAADLQRTDAQRGGGAEESGNNGQAIDDARGQGIRGAIAKERHQDGAHQRHAAAAERHVGHAQAHDGVNCPGVKAPVHGCLRHGAQHRFIARSLIGTRARRKVVAQRLEGAEEDNADANAGAKEHRSPAHRGKFRLLPI